MITALTDGGVRSHKDSVIQGNNLDVTTQRLCLDSRKGENMFWQHQAIVRVQVLLLGNKREQSSAELVSGTDSEQTDHRQI